MAVQVEEQCEKRVSRGFHSTRCNRKGTLTHEGKRYCKQHYPPNVEARDKKRNAKWDAEWKAKEQGWKRDAAIKQAFPVMLEALEEITAWLEPGWAEANGAKCETRQDALALAKKALRLARKAKRLGA
jgi:hypothetical protein